MKLCKDCKHYQARGFFQDCRWNVRESLDPVLGGTKFSGRTENCYAERSNTAPGFCGPEGKHWEAKDAQATA